MTARTARAIYRLLYWNPLRADALPIGVDLSALDMGVNAGIWRTARLLQRALRFTREEVGRLHWPRDPGRRSKVRPAHHRHRPGRTAAYYRSLADFPILGTGWLDRTAARRNAALAMIAGAE